MTEVKHTPTKLTDDELEELGALAATNDAVGLSFIYRSHWHESGYRKMVRAGLVLWTAPPPGFDGRKFAGTMITDAGRAALSKAGA